MPNSASKTGMFSSRGACVKWVSISNAPSSNPLKFSNPKAREIGRPIADQSEYRPPTQSHMGKMFSSAIPNSVAALTFEDTATKCLAMSCCVPPDFKNHSFAVSVFCNVSWVENDFEDITTKVSSKSTRDRTSWMWQPSTFATK